MRLVAAIIALSACLTINAQSPAAPPRTYPRIVITVPDNVRSESMWIRYALHGASGGGGLLKAQPGVHDYSIDATAGQRANIIIYAPGCQFKTYSFDLNESDVTKEFVCDRLPTKTIRGFLPPEKIPKPWTTNATGFDIVAELNDHWTCGFLLTLKRDPRTTLIAGSCLGSPVNLGRVGEIDSSKNGYFEIIIPDFTHDPTFAGYNARFQPYGVITFVLREQAIDHARAAIQPADVPARTGLPVQSEYADPLVFTVMR